MYTFTVSIFQRRVVVCLPLQGGLYFWVERIWDRVSQPHNTPLSPVCYYNFFITSPIQQKLTVFFSKIPFLMTHFSENFALSENSTTPPFRISMNFLYSTSWYHLHALILETMHNFLLKSFLEIWLQF